MFVLNFYSPIFVDQLKRGRKTATIRLGDKSKKYRKGEVVLITVGFQHSPREKIFEAVIDSVEVKQVRDLSPRDIEHDNPEFRRLDEMVHFLEQIYGRKVETEDDRHRGALLADLGPPVGGPGAHAARWSAPELEPSRNLHLRLALCVLECQAAGTRTPGVPRKLHSDGGMSMNLKPLGDRLIVQAIEEEETTASGIVLPDTAKEKPQRGKVLAVGDGRWDEDGEKRIPLDVAKGDEVLYSKYGGTEVQVEGEDLLVLRESDVLAKIAGKK